MASIIDILQILLNRKRSPDDLKNQGARDLIRETGSQKVKEKSVSLQHDLYTSISHELLESTLPDHEKTKEQIWQEGETIIGPGVETASWNTFRVIYELLTAELETAIPDLATRISRNGARISESLRLSYRVNTRVLHISPDEHTKVIQEHPSLNTASRRDTGWQEIGTCSSRPEVVPAVKCFTSKSVAR
ncbi:hypothetical protein F4775DRAFT_595374 [Biscogniauxia sp. FL1348]|nr:hypothetical protein F4775DRAFT_595374 [Biscogniauxia sp. FL1348]